MCVFVYTNIKTVSIVFVSVVLAHKIELSTYAKGILRVQRTLLITVCKRYRTLSDDVLQVLT